MSNSQDRKIVSSPESLGMSPSCSLGHFSGGKPPSACQIHTASDWGAARGYRAADAAQHVAWRPHKVSNSQDRKIVSSPESLVMSPSCSLGHFSGGKPPSACQIPASGRSTDDYIVGSDRPP